MSNNIFGFLHKLVFSRYFRKVYCSFQSLVCSGFSLLEIFIMKVQKKMKREAFYEFLPWDHINYKDQIEECFKIVRTLNN
jgi:hypothetical protein